MARITPENDAPEQEAILLASEQTVSVSKDKLGCGRMMCMLMCGPCACIQGRRFIWFAQPLTQTSEKIIRFWLYLVTAFNFVGSLFSFARLYSADELMAATNPSVVRWLAAISKFHLGLSVMFQGVALGAAAIIGGTLMAIPQARLRLFLRQHAWTISAPGTFGSAAFPHMILGLGLNLFAVNLSAVHPKPPKPAAPTAATAMTETDIALLAVSMGGFGIAFFFVVFEAWKVFQMWFASFHSSHVMKLLEQDADDIEANLRKES